MYATSIYKKQAFLHEACVCVYYQASLHGCNETLIYLAFIIILYYRIQPNLTLLNLT